MEKSTSSQTVSFDIAMPDLFCGGVIVGLIYQGFKQFRGLED